jgi:hypothetical protein
VNSEGEHAMSPRLVRRTAALLLFANGVLHFALVSKYLKEERFVGSLFIPAAAVLVCVAVWLWVRDSRTAWAVGGIVTTLMLLALVASRTMIGFFGFHDHWEQPAVLAIGLEVILLTIWALLPWVRQAVR